MELYREPSDKYGNFMNGTWDGIIGMVHRNEVDFLMNPVVPREPVLEFSYFTNPITIEAFSVLSGKEKKEAGLFLYFSVLDKWVWNGILIAFVVVALTSAILYKKIVQPADINWIRIFSQYIWLLFSYMLRQRNLVILVCSHYNPAWTKHGEKCIFSRFKAKRGLVIKATVILDILVNVLANSATFFLCATFYGRLNDVIIYQSESLRKTRPCLMYKILPFCC
ncbi:uncharacterized protein LOC118199174 [Stegodyphus dumicola]|uniref:uncharacterized protein LOC118199174 n=1 Tax=Stegodyphus dumicola TaxID=202533 RepID=UPI0015A8404C|nr:uncharacterized protein LOC118199174 [Stegodyphus dumicola]